MVKSNAGSQVFICSAPKNSDLTLSMFQNLEYTKIGQVGSFGTVEIRASRIRVEAWNRNNLATHVKGMKEIPDTLIEFARSLSDIGQDILNAAALTNNAYAVRVVRNDGEEDADGQPTVFYYRVLVDGPSRPNGRNEDFDLEIFSLIHKQKEIKVVGHDIINGLSSDGSRVYILGKVY